MTAKPAAIAAKQAATTIRVSRRIMHHIEENAHPEESVNDTLKRLLKIGKNGSAWGGPKAPPLMRTIKVEKDILDLIIKRAKPKEPRDHTLSRLLGLAKDDGNVMLTGKEPKK
jgi:hypothetical protein